MMKDLHLYLSELTPLREDWRFPKSSVKLAEELFNHDIYINHVIRINGVDAEIRVF